VVLVKWLLILKQCDNNGGIMHSEYIRTPCNVVEPAIVNTYVVLFIKNSHTQWIGMKFLYWCHRWLNYLGPVHGELSEEVGHTFKRHLNKLYKKSVLIREVNGNSVTRHSSCQLIHARINQTKLAHELVVWRFHRNPSQNPKCFHKTKYITCRLRKE